MKSAWSAPKIVGAQKKECSTAGLVSNNRLLLLVCCFCKQKAASATGRCNDDPSLFFTEASVFGQLKTQFLDIKINCLIILIDYQAYMGDVLHMRMFEPRLDPMFYCKFIIT